MLVSSHSFALKLLNSLHLIADARYPPEDFPSYLVFHLNALTSLTNVELLTFSSKKRAEPLLTLTPPGSEVTFPKHLFSPWRLYYKKRLLCSALPSPETHAPIFLYLQPSSTPGLSFSNYLRHNLQSPMLDPKFSQIVKRHKEEKPQC